mgnify:CR=1 FL=1
MVSILFLNSLPKVTQEHYLNKIYTFEKWWKERGYKLENAELSYLGQAERVIIDKDNTTIINGSGKSEEISARVSQIKSQMEQTTSDYDKEKLQERLAKLAGVLRYYILVLLQK